MYTYFKKRKMSLCVHISLWVLFHCVCIFFICMYTSFFVCTYPSLCVHILLFVYISFFVCTYLSLCVPFFFVCTFFLCVYLFSLCVPFFFVCTFFFCVYLFSLCVPFFFVCTFFLCVYLFLCVHISLFVCRYFSLCVHILLCAYSTQFSLLLSGYIWPTLTSLLCSSLVTVKCALQIFFFFNFENFLLIMDSLPFALPLILPSLWCLSNIYFHSTFSCFNNHFFFLCSCKAYPPMVA